MDLLGMDVGMGVQSAGKLGGDKGLANMATNQFGNVQSASGSILANSRSKRQDCCYLERQQHFQS